MKLLHFLPHKKIEKILRQQKTFITVKIPKISPGAYIFQRPFLRGLFLEGLIFRGDNLWRKICVSKSIGLVLQLKGNLPFLLCFTLYLRAISKYKPPGAYIWRGDLTEGFLHLVMKLGGLYMEGLIFRILRFVPRKERMMDQRGNLRALVGICKFH